ncbi:MAG: DNA-binding protein [Gammaproteobacteria bacterium]|nr:MAG: DNA-binding protein [Gammaproteobacteria bacterium]
MTKITSNPDCGNSPKMEFLKKFNIAFATGDIEFMIDSVSDDIVWEIIGDRKIEGKEKFTQYLEEIKSIETDELVIDHILSHGKEEGAASGIMKTKGGKKYAFADFYTFSGAKGATIKSFTSYVIEL